jgi:single-stranded-DNA-specific exonuclease
MNYKLRNAIQPRDIETCLEDILTLRGVEDIESFLNPSSMCELNPFNLDNVEEGAEMLLNHLNRKSRICFVVD